MCRRCSREFSASHWTKWPESASFGSVALRGSHHPLLRRPSPHSVSHRLEPFPEACPVSGPLFLLVTDIDCNVILNGNGTRPQRWQVVYIDRPLAWHRLRRKVDLVPRRQNCQNYAAFFVPILIFCMHQWSCTVRILLFERNCHRKRIQSGVVPCRTFFWMLWMRVGSFPRSSTVMVARVW